MRPKKPRLVNCRPGKRHFIPKDKKKPVSSVYLSMDELEAIRLANLEELDQNQIAKQMAVHRSTISRILASAHKKIADALVHLKEIKVEAGCCTFVKNSRGKYAKNCS